MCPYLLALTFFKFNMTALKKRKRGRQTTPPPPAREKKNLISSGRGWEKTHPSYERFINGPWCHSIICSPWLTFFAFTHSRSSQIKGCSLHGQSSCTSQVLLNTRWHWEKEDCGLDKGKAIHSVTLIDVLISIPWYQTVIWNSQGYGPLISCMIPPLQRGQTANCCCSKYLKVVTVHQ